MSIPRYMMENEFEQMGYEYEDYEEKDDYDYEEKDDEIYYSKYGENECAVCMGGSYIRKIFIGYESEGDYDEDYDY